jgi:hypothetical protein
MHISSMCMLNNRCCTNPRSHIFTTYFYFLVVCEWGLRPVPTSGVIRDSSHPCRPSYIKEWWSVVNLAKVSEYYEKYAAQGKPVVCDLMLPAAFWHLPPARSSPLDPRQLTRPSMVVMHTCAYARLHTPTEVIRGFVQVWG